ncbi:MAG: GH116 family glycosyl hydrolase [Candidatus Bathyarchaeota archaeon]|nr:GH116 family glycosyl hydrolase [Candidatus Bathyarchaeota archaeon]
MEVRDMRWPFNPDVPKHQWTLIAAQGYPEPVPGCVYLGTRLDGGIPLGALGTGYFTLEGTGKTGFCSIYNDIVPPRRDFREWLTIRIGHNSLPLSTAEIYYWGHYPIADIVAHFTERPLTVGIRAFSPFIVGSAEDSNIPASLFEIELSNLGQEKKEAQLVITPPSPPKGKSMQAELLGDGLKAESDESVCGLLPVTIPRGDSVRLRFVFGWYAPHWRDSGGEPHTHRYGLRYESASAVAEDVLSRFDELLSRVLGWQREIYRAELPDWLRDGLVQSFYSFAKNTVWIARTRQDEWWGEDGWFTHSESHTGCPITETMVCRMHGHFAALFFFPDLETTTLEAFRHFQISDGEIPFSYGMGTSMRDPRYHCQHPLNSGQYAQMIYRLFVRTRDQEQLLHFYDSVKRAIRYQFSLDDDGDGLVNDQAHVPPGEHWPANQFYDIWPWWGTSAYVAGTWLGTLAVGKAMGETMKDSQFVAECEEWMERGQKAYHEKLWTGEYYRLWNDPVNSRSCDVSLGNQLMGQWCVKVAGLPNVLPEECVQSALRAIEWLNMKATTHGLVNGVTPQGERYDAGYHGGNDNDHGKHIFIGENLCAAMTFMYHNRRDIGLEIARRLYEAVALESCSPWNQRCLVNAETGLPVWGDDYYSNLVIWAVPMAIAGEGMSEFTEDGKLVSKMIKAARLWKSST